MGTLQGWVVGPAPYLECAVPGKIQRIHRPSNWSCPGCATRTLPGPTPTPSGGTPRFPVPAAVERGPRVLNMFSAPATVTLHP